MGLEVGLVVAGISAVLGLFGTLAANNAAATAEAEAQQYVNKSDEQLAAAQQQTVIAQQQALTSEEAAARSVEAQREAKDIQAAQYQIENTQSRRQRIREERIRRARIVAASENAGTNSSSGAFGAVGALNTNLAGLVAQASGLSRANTGINTFNQVASDEEFSAQAGLRKAGAAHQMAGAYQGYSGAYLTRASTAVQRGQTQANNIRSTTQAFASLFDF